MNTSTSNGSKASKASAQAQAPRDATSKERNWFPKVESVAIGILGYVCESDGKLTLEDIVVQMGCNCVSAAGALWQLRSVGYIATRRNTDRIPAKRNPKWGRNVLHATRRGRERFAKHEEEMTKGQTG